MGLIIFIFEFKDPLMDIFISDHMCPYLIKDSRF